MAYERLIRTTWTEAQVRRLLDEEPLHYQRIELPFGLATGGADRAPTAARIFPADLSGKTVLDVGSLSGYFCFEALRRGARAALGIEIDPERLRRARLLADCLGLPARFELADVEKDRIAERFDHVLCLNVLHHTRNPLAVLDTLVAATRERLVLEVASIGRHDRRKLGLSALSSRLLSRHPVLYAAGRLRSDQRYFFTAKAIENVLQGYRGLFPRIEILPSQHKDRFIAIAHRRSVGRLVVVAGPTAAGKSTVIARLERGDLPELAARLDLGDPAGWRVVAGNEKAVAAFQDTRVDRLILHYDFLRSRYKHGTTYERDPGLDVVEAAAEVQLVTVWTEPGRLRRQLERAELREVEPGTFEGNARHRTLWQDYQDAALVRRHYRDWFRYAARIRGAHHVISLGDPPRLYPAAEWEARLEAGEA